MGTGVRTREFWRSSDAMDEQHLARASVEVKLATSMDREQVAGLCIEARSELGMPCTTTDALLVATQVEGLMTDPGTVVISGWVETRLVGVAVVRMASANPFVPTCELHLDSLYVASRWRRRGIGQALLAKVVVLAEENEVESVVAIAPAPERMTARFMARRGFVARAPHRAVALPTLRRMIGKAVEFDRRGLTREEIIALRKRRSRDTGGMPRVDIERDRTAQRGLDTNAQVRRADAIRRSA